MQYYRCLFRVVSALVLLYATRLPAMAQEERPREQHSPHNRAATPIPEARFAETEIASTLRCLNCQQSYPSMIPLSTVFGCLCTKIICQQCLRTYVQGSIAIYPTYHRTMPCLNCDKRIATAALCERLGLEAPQEPPIDDKQRTPSPSAYKQLRRRQPTPPAAACIVAAHHAPAPIKSNQEATKQDQEEVAPAAVIVPAIVPAPVASAPIPAAAPAITNPVTVPLPPQAAPAPAVSTPRVTTARVDNPHVDTPRITMPRVDTPPVDTPPRADTPDRQRRAESPSYRDLVQLTPKQQRRLYAQQWTEPMPQQITNGPEYPRLDDIDPIAQQSKEQASETMQAIAQEITAASSTVLPASTPPVHRALTPPPPSPLPTIVIQASSENGVGTATAAAITIGSVAYLTYMLGNKKITAWWQQQQPLAQKRYKRLLLASIGAASIATVYYWASKTA
ncbi:hypothetical protein M1466_01450 [Candidatus Dependentiae bacterium]|nr:hypothetical protein [Candidatus Dependentiae bacterium]